MNCNFFKLILINIRMKKSFKKGDKVLCINDDFSNVPVAYRKIQRFPIQGQIYTIRKVFSETVWLEEIVNDILYLDGITEEATFYKFRFAFLAHKNEVAESALVEIKKPMKTKKKKELDPKTLPSPLV
jgi:hypothetical protein